VREPYTNTWEALCALASGLELRATAARGAQAKRLEAQLSALREAMRLYTHGPSEAQLAAAREHRAAEADFKAQCDAEVKEARERQAETGR
jgi:hypothetical protein